MEIQGKIIQKLPLQQGTSRAGNAWSKQVYVLETLDAYPKKVAFDFFGERINQYDAICAVGATITLSYDIESREYQGRWYTDIRGWKAEPFDPAAAQPMQPAAPYGPGPADPIPGAPPAPPAGPVTTPTPNPTDFTQQDTEDDLPF
ncbi:MAG: DUF3127 domain-containing protein [Muribaculaceae bacterium]|nr:DUF3127 domain-containing protein [Muribaculaceae bacterium]